MAITETSKVKIKQELGPESICHESINGNVHVIYIKYYPKAAVAILFSILNITPLKTTFPIFSN